MSKTNSETTTEKSVTDEMNNQVSKNKHFFGLRNDNNTSCWLNSIFQCLIHLPFPINKPVDLSVSKDSKEVVYRFEALRSKMIQSSDKLNSFIPPEVKGDPVEVS